MEVVNKHFHLTETHGALLNPTRDKNILIVVDVGVVGRKIASDVFPTVNTVRAIASRLIGDATVNRVVENSLTGDNNRETRRVSFANKASPVNKSNLEPQKRIWISIRQGET